MLDAAMIVSDGIPVASLCSEFGVQGVGRERTLGQENQERVSEYLRFQANIQYPNPIAKFEDEGIGYRGEEIGYRGEEIGYRGEGEKKSWVLSFELGGEIGIRVRVTGRGSQNWRQPF